MKYFYQKFVLEKQGVQKLYKSVKNTEHEPVMLKDNIIYEFEVPLEFNRIVYYTSSWGKEFTKMETVLEDSISFENIKGRCGAQSNPFFSMLSSEQGIDVAILTSGNYHVTISKKNTYINIIIKDGNSEFATYINPNETFLYPVVYAHKYGSLKQCYLEKQKFMKQEYRKLGLHNSLPIVYNHWWAYEDKHINEKIILENAKLAKSIGVDMLVLDAGWFGNDDEEEHWEFVRGDWYLENKKRFPSGITSLSKKIQEIGLDFGIWCEIEGVGEKSSVYREHPDFIAYRNNETLGYLCFAKEEVQKWAIQTMSEIFEKYQVKHWKLDFNLDPGVGCDREYHGHGKEDGLIKHYEGLRNVILELRKKFPDIVFENCSSGGQRLNLELAKYFDVSFLSDPDYSSHQLRIFEEVSKWLMPKQILHFMWSNTVNTESGAPFKTLNLDDVSEVELKYHMRVAFMHQMGISHRLREYSAMTLKRMKEELSFYKHEIKNYILDSNYYPLLLHDRCKVFYFEKERTSLIFVFTQEAGTHEISLRDIKKWNKIIDLDTGETLNIENSIYNLTTQNDLECHIFQVHHKMK